MRQFNGISSIDKKKKKARLRQLLLQLINSIINNWYDYIFNGIRNRSTIEDKIGSMLKCFWILHAEVLNLKDYANFVVLES